MARLSHVGCDMGGESEVSVECAGFISVSVSKGDAVAEEELFF